MIIQFYVIFSYIVVSYREHFVPIISEILRKKHKITKNTIRKVIIFFAEFNEQFHEQYKTHMFKLHEHYLTKLREQKGAVTNTVVINYVNNLAPSLLMYCLNYNFRKRNVDTLKADLV